MARRKQTESESAGGTPRKVLDAFVPPLTRIGDTVLYPMSIAHFLAFERIKSPVLTDMRKAEIEDALRALILLSVPGTEALSLAAAPAELEARLPAFAAQLPVADIKPMAFRLAAYITNAFATVVPGKESERGPFTGAQPKARDSAGSSPSTTPCAPSTSRPTARP